MRTLGALLVVAVCTGCSLNAGNGLLIYESGDTRVKASRYNVKNADDSRTTFMSLDTKADSESIPDAKIILIHQIMSTAQGVFDRDYLRTLDEPSLERILKAVKND